MSFYIAIIGAGVVSAITNLMLYLINNKNKIIVFELNKKIALENSRVINNAGTGHAGMCENNYVKVINNEYFVKKNIRIFCKFNLTKNFFSWIKIINIFNFKNILTKTPHVSFFFFKKNIKLKKIVNKIRFYNKSIKFTNNAFFLNKIFPLLIKKKKIKKNYSISYYRNGFDINYQYLSKKIFFFLTKKKIINLYLSYEIIKIKKIKNFFSIRIFKYKKIEILVDYVFVCAGGSTLPLLKNFNKFISKKYFELPIDGTWLICEEKKKILKHNLKVYSETIKNNPPMSIPHLDMRNIFKEKKIFFGPFAGLTFRVLVNKNKTIFKSINLKFVFNIVFFTIKNYSIINYLLKENFKTKKKKIFDIFGFTKLLDKTYTKKAGKRLQILKRKKNFFNLNFGTKLIFNKNRKIAFLIGASPGASISVSIVSNLLNFWFKMPNKFLFKIKKINKKSKIFNSLLYLKGIEPFSF
ncbi:malate:quinone oxidoreductase [Candidatus Carsonella ruddii]|nr:malate:quinone oxidoreductase [Candidatus Carsonella ruddii]WGS66598.1 malate:quinone oxidoreductase [Candidatus Carsonella ruddii]WGS66796.1 malate:quinone oxidoreductase [Candidatus Carsonella ruddii]WGS66987.1 malate:quinone oxidoreductase [Candidatus Carsonella ruddii]WMC18195.1 MAG: malate:quinone oxidoreductase [Candidatus Carsonella ruddii]WMC18389.1 MAG: malate:quinone oxidoreductase [Candidatus Carsonella ruddii]